MKKHTYTIETLSGDFYASRNPEGSEMLNNLFIAYAGGIKVCSGRSLKTAISKAQRRLSRITQADFDTAIDKSKQ